MVRLIIVALIFSSALGALSDSERNQALTALVAKDMTSVPRHLKRWLDEQNVPLEPQAIVGDYQRIKKMVGRISKHIKKPCSVGGSEEHRAKNAHPKMPPIDATRTLRHLENFYFSANDVFTPLQEYIISQGPLETTILDFWRALIETNVPTIVALAMPSDAGGRNPAYWEKSRYPLTVEGWTITAEGDEEVLDKSEAYPAQRVVKRTFQATNDDAKTKRTISHIHYENWPDNGAPDPVLFHRFLHLMNSLHPVSSSPLLIHCSAGLGRSGTLAASHSLCKEIHAFHPSTINIPQRVVELRMQRSYLVSTATQYEAIYEAVRRCVASLTPPPAARATDETDEAHMP